MPRLRVLGVLSPGGAQVARYVEAVSAVHQGGSVYFNRLDSLIGRDPTVMASMQELVEEKFGSHVSIVVSGGFGMEYRDWARANRMAQPNYWLPGGLRRRGEPTWSMANEARAHLIGWPFDVVFIDDSMYLGRTIDWVHSLVLMAGRRFVGSVVAYDGSRTKRRDVHSLYRYWDHFAPE